MWFQSSLQKEDIKGITFGINWSSLSGTNPAEGFAPAQRTL